jgi:PST family polysaccharide transporter
MPKAPCRRNSRQERIGCKLFAIGVSTPAVVAPAASGCILVHHTKAADKVEQSPGKPKNEPRQFGLRTTAIRGIIVTGGGTVFKAILQVLAIVVLARLLSPEDFGVMAMVFPIIAFATIFQQAGLGMAVLQRQSVTNEELSTIFWANVVIGTLIGALLVLVAPLVADFYSEPRLVALTAASGALMILSGLSSQHIILLMRRMAYGRLAAMDLGALAFGTCLAIAWAYFFRSYWAIFLLTFGTNAALLVMAWALDSWRPGRTAPLRHVRDVLVFGGHTTMANFATFWGQNLDKILIGRFVGSVAVGLYERAYKVVLLPVLFVHMPLFRVLVPMLSKSRSDPDRYRRLFITGFQLSLFVTLPGTLLLIVAAAEFVVFVLGQQWLDAAPIFAWLAIATLGQLATGPFSMIFVSQDRAREGMIASVVSSIFASLAFVFGLSWGAVGVAAAYAISELIRAPALLWYATRVGPVSVRNIVSALLPFFLTVALAVPTLFWLKPRLDSNGDFLLFVGVAGAATYGLLLACLVLNRTSRAFLEEAAAVARTVLRAETTSTAGTSR